MEIRILFFIYQNKDKGFFFIPCVVKNILKDTKIINEEVFGPIAPIIEVKDKAQAVKICNVNWKDKLDITRDINDATYLMISGLIR